MNDNKRGNMFRISVLCVVLAGAVAGCTRADPTYCDEKDPSCPEGQVCNIPAKTCIPVDGSVPGEAGPDLGQDSGPGQDLALDAASGDADALLPDLLSPDGPLAQNGTSCTSGGQCVSGQCVDGYCCESSCDTLCRSCAVAGKEGICSLIADGQDPDAECTGSVAACDGACDGQGACSYPGAGTSCGSPACSQGSLTTYACDGAGGCDSSSSGCGGYACNSAGDDCRTDCTASTQCTGTFQCVGNACVNSLPLGAACGTNDSACTSGHCVDGVCCNSTCTGTCKSCSLSASKGTCSSVPSGQDPDGECAGTDAACGGTCNGSGACSYASSSTQCKSPVCSNSSLTTYKCDGSGSCDGTSSSCSGFACASTTACKTTCSTDGDCASGHYCIGGSCVSNLPLGSACAGKSAACASGYCVDGVCCNNGCTGTCKSCSLTASKGTCSSVPSGQDPAGECTGSDPACGGSCNGAGACSYPSTSTQCKTPVCSSSILTSYTCDGLGGCDSASASCKGYLCASATACRTSCTTDSHCAAGYYCIGSKCVNNLPLGTACAGKNGACASGFCVDGVCCDTGCTSSCQACNLTGKVGTCSNVPNGTSCGASSCTGNTLSLATCQSGTCSSSTAACPGKLKCGSTTSCLSSCSDVGDCVNSHLCVTGTCLSWVAKASGTTSSLRGVWGATASNIWAVGSGGLILHYNGSSWSSVTSPVSFDLYTVWGASGSDIWAGGAGTKMLHYNGSTWTATNVGTPCYQSGIWGGGGTVWATCTEETKLIYSTNGGSTWNTQPVQGTTGKTLDVFGTSSSDVWTVLSDGSAAHIGGGWIATPAATGAVHGIWGAATDDYWTVGYRGQSCHYNGSKWDCPTPITSNKDLYDIWGSSGSNLVAVGEGGMIVRFNGTSWYVVPSGTTAHLRGVWVGAPTDIWIVGDSGTVLHTE